jgi:hypothetical protein
MKRKMKGVLVVVLAFVMLASLAVGLAAVPASASPGNLEWETYNLPVEGARGGWFMDSRIEYVGPIAQAINGDLYAAVGYYDESWNYYNDIFKSTDGGRSWSISKNPLYAYPLVSDPGSKLGIQIVDIVCSSEDADVLYVTDGSYVYYSNDGGTTFHGLATGLMEDAISTAGISNPWINSLDVAYAGGYPYVFISVINDSTAGLGDIFYIEHKTGLSLAWNCLDLQGSFSGYDPYTVNCPPNFADTSEVYAVISNSSPSTIVVNYSPDSGTWQQFGAELWLVQPPTSTQMQIDHASNICFPADFADDELYVGVSGNTTNQGGVFRVDSLPAPGCTFRLSDPVTGVPGDAGYADIWSLDITGSIGSVQLLAGAENDINVWYSNTEGETWSTSRKPPTGDTSGGDVYVLMAADFAAGGEAFAATYGYHECGFSRTTTGGDLWNQISLISTDMDRVQDVSFYPNYCSSGELFMVAKNSYGSGEDSLWRFDGTYWERVAEQTMLEYVFGISDVDIHLVQVSPDILSTGVVYFTGWNLHQPVPSSSPVMFKSADEGEYWQPIGCQPAAVYSWLVIDKNTIIVGGSSGQVYKNTSGGTRCWSKIDTTLDSNDIITDLAFTGDTVLAVGYYSGNWSEVAISEDVGDTWNKVGDSLPPDLETCVAFDTDYATNSTFYVANTPETEGTSTSAIYRCVIDSSLPWYAQEYTDIKGDIAIDEISGIVTYNGCLYVSDYGNGYGMWRSVNPTGPMTPSSKAPLFERVGYRGTSPLFTGDTGGNFDKVHDPAAATSYFSDASLWRLQATCNNTIWALDWNHTNVLWTFTDCLCCGVDLSDASPACGLTVDSTNSAYLDWSDACNADCYDVWVNTNESFNTCCWIYNTPCSEDSCLSLSDLPSGTTFYWKVRVAPGEPLASKWSDVCSFSTQMGAAQWNPFSGPVSEYPYPGSSNVPIRPTFAWNAAEWATGYEFVLADNEGFVGPLAEETVASPVYVLGFDLQYSTTYYWKVRAVSATSASNWATGIFTTAAAPTAQVWTDPATGLTYPTREALEAAIAARTAPVTPATPFYIWVIVAIGAVLVIAVIVLIVTTRRTP